MTTINFNYRVIPKKLLIELLKYITIEFCLCVRCLRYYATISYLITYIFLSFFYK